MIGTIVNSCTILTGSFIGSFVSRGISEKYKTALFNALGLATVGLGANAFVSNMGKTGYPVLFIASLAIGTVLGPWLDIDGHFQKLLARALSWQRGYLRRYCFSASAPCRYWGLLKAGLTAITPIFLPTPHWIL